jgi:predicted peptidase
MKCATCLLPTLLTALLVAVPAAAAEQKSAGTQQKKHFEKEIKMTVKMNYLLFLPEGYDKGDKQWPLIMFLHGAGETGSDLDLVKKHGPPKIVETKKDFPFIVLSPQSPRLGWDTGVLTALLDEVVAKYRVDRDRVYLTGLSMGGYGTWALAAEHPDRFAALVPICGGGDPGRAKKLKDIPIWVFHGARDGAVPLKNSERMVEALKAVGGNVKFTVYPNAGHDSWTESYNNPKLYTWLLEQKRKPVKRD